MTSFNADFIRKCKIDSLEFGIIKIKCPNCGNNPLITKKNCYHCLICDKVYHFNADGELHELE